MIFDVISRLIIKAFIGFYRRQFTVAVLRPQHVDAAAALLAEEFCRREPLCRHLNLKPESLLDFFHRQVRFVAERGLSLVVLSKRGDVIGAITVEDELDPFLPDTTWFSPELKAIDTVLQGLQLPPAYAARRRRDVFYCGLAAVSARFRKTPVFLLLIAGIYLHLGQLGFRRGYAKISNPAIPAKLRRLERRLRLRIFTLVAEASERDYPASQVAALQRFRIALITWPVSFKSQDAASRRSDLRSRMPSPRPS